MRFFWIMLLALPGCAVVSDLSQRVGLGGAPEEPIDAFAPVPTESALAPVTAAPPPPQTVQTAEALDTTTPAQRAAAVAPPQAPQRDLGTTVVSLGAATEPGLWLKTPLVSKEIAGRVTNPSNGKSASVTLFPLEGPVTAGSQMSLAAMRLLELPLTDLTQVTVARDG